ncbi:CocE/NonD family hydrolase [Microbacterium sp. No. 7]|uniref:CocE/NonD family hydrolase n=1 Tax=Microbacterium sp. No. 7 TaxID=1714373 RepID=UPI0006D256BB|nr:CocE/NonD family hydrolase [Microbacterium sp. No. 7]ALJ20495.1 hypothetical protein AOA12_11505 [Microbacterium sp. No. 7]
MTKPRYGLLDRYLTRANGLPRGRAYSTTEHEVAVGDGTVLKAAHYAPVGHARGTLVAMTPYGRAGIAARLVFGIYASQGYHVLATSVRGSFGSGGAFNPMFHDGSDFRDVVAWMREQSWYTGAFASFGASYLGWTQWALLSEPQPDHKAAVIVVGPHDVTRFHWGSGTFTSALPVWAALLDVQETSPLRSVRHALTKGEPIHRLLRRPAIAQELFEIMPAQRSWLEDRITHDVDDPYWAPFDLSETLERVDVPVLISTGWQDIFATQSLEQFERLSARGTDVALTVGPWEHTRASGGPMLVKEALEWLGTHLAGAGPTRRSRVHLHVTGADEWRDLETWPPATAPRRLHLTPRALAETATSSDVSFSFDPADPPVFPGGPLLFGGGYADDKAVAERDDVFAVVSESLETDLEVHGRIVVVLDHSAEQPDSNIFVRVSDIDERGRSRNVAQGDRRVRADGTIRIDLTPIAHRFRSGHRIRVAIAGGAHPHFPASPGTGENPMLATRRIPNRHTLRLEASYIELPVAASTM